MWNILTMVRAALWLLSMASDITSRLAWVAEMVWVNISLGFIF